MSKADASNKKEKNGGPHPALPSPQYPSVSCVMTSQSKPVASNAVVIEISSDSDAPPFQRMLAPLLLAKQKAQQKDINLHRDLVTTKTKDQMRVSDMNSFADHSIINLT